MQPRILIVDTESSTADKLKQLLVAEGYLAEATSIAAGVCQMMQSQIYDLVLANPCIKDSEGNDVMSLCRIVDPTLPVLHLVAFLGQKPGTPGAAANLRNAIAKPVRRDDLLAAIERVLESSRLQRESRELRGRLGIGP
jgi:DNA-binding NtrC family response regulator